VLQGVAGGQVSQMHAFGMIEHCFSSEVLENKLNEDLARAMHEEYRLERIGDIQRGCDGPGRDIATQKWEDLDDGLKDSNQQQADHVDIKLHVLGLERVNIADPRPAVDSFDPGEIELLAEMEHNRWNAERWLKDWAPGPGDKPRRVTPYLVPWSELPENIKKYDRKTVGKIPDFLRAVNQKACRKVIST
jgi:hypothetical protein